MYTLFSERETTPSLAFLNSACGSRRLLMVDLCSFDSHFVLVFFALTRKLFGRQPQKGVITIHVA